MAAANVNWRFFLCKSPVPGEDPTLPLKKITWLRDARDKALNVAQNRSGDVGFQFPARGKWAVELHDPANCILATRNDEDIWSGPIATLSGSSSNKFSGMMPVKAVGWLDLADYRELREDVSYGATNNYSHLSGAVAGQGTTLPAGHTAAEGTSWNDAEIIFDLINKINGYDPAHAMPITPGIAVGTRYVRQKSWTKGTKLSQCLRDLTDLEAGIDITVNPTTRKLDVYSWDSYTDHPEIVLGFNKPPFNCSEFSWSQDNMAIRNRMPLAGKNGASALVQDSASMDLYGIREESVNLPDVGESDILLYYGGAEVAIKKAVHRFYTVVPKQTTAKSPQPFDDFKIGDALRTSIDFGPIQEDQRAVRAFGMALSFPDLGGEKITGLTTLANQVS
jgi:hypothetical protein